MSAVALVVGHVALDRVGGGAMPGGSAFYAARALAGLGARVLVLTAAGPDWPADALTTPIGSIEAVILPSPSTTTFENVYGPDGRRSQRVHAAARPLDPAALPEAWRTPDLLLVAPVLGEVEPAAFTRAVRARTAGLCAQGLVREVAADGAVVPRRLEGPAAAFAGLDLAVLSEDEAAGQPDLVPLLVAAVPLVALTRGARGCELLGARGGGRHVGVHAAREVDPTGAGDVFAAAMLLALARGDEPGAAARLGAAAASIVVEGRGGEALPRIGEAWARAGCVPILAG